MAGGEKKKVRLPALPPLVLWGGIVALLALGLLVSTLDLLALPDKAREQAIEATQRFVIDAKTGTVTAGKVAPVTPGEDAQAATPAHEPPASAEPVAPSSEAASETPDSATPTDAAAPPATDSAAETTPAPDATEATPSASAPAPAAEPNEPAAQATTHEDAHTALPADAPTLRTEPLSTKLDAPQRTRDSLVAAPAPEITEDVNGMKLPKRNEKGDTAAQLYARPFKRTAETVPIAFVVMNAGLDTQSVGFLLRLPPEVSVAYSPYARPSENYAEHLRSAGHELWALLPSMTDNYPAEDPGPLGLIAKMPGEELLRRTQAVMAAVPGSVGLALPANESISLQKDALSATLGELNKRGLLLFQGNPKHSVEQITGNAGLAEMVRRADMILDPEPNEALIRSRLAGLLESAKAKGAHVVVLSARPQTLEILADWLSKNTLPEGVALAPLSSIYQPKEAPKPAAEEASAEHGSAKKEKKAEKPVEKKPKPLPQDQYLKPAGKEGEKKEGGH